MFKTRLNSNQIREEFQKLVRGNYTAQQRGYEFEKLVFSLLDNEKLEPRASYKPGGEQVDGSFYYQGQTFLIEAKWVKDPVSASSIYSFKGKLDGKFHTSSGIYISVNGFSSEVEDALKFGKSLNILLFDEGDVSLIFNGDVTFSEVLKFKLRQAGDTGSLKVPYKLRLQAQEIFDSNTEIIENVLSVRSDSKYQKKDIHVDDLLVFVEGEYDSVVIKNLFSLLKKKYSLSYKVIVLGGKNNIRQLPSLINLYGDYEKTKAVIVILDDDNDAKKIEPVMKNLSTQFENSSTPVRSLFLMMNDKLRLQIANSIISFEIIMNDVVFERLENFIKQIVEDYYNPVQATPFEVVKSRLESFGWDFESGSLEGVDEYTGMPFSLTSIDELVNYLNEEIIKEMYGVMPLDWLKEQNELDYEDLVREILVDSFFDRLSLLGWDISKI